MHGTAVCAGEWRLIPSRGDSSSNRSSNSTFEATNSRYRYKSVTGLHCHSHLPYQPRWGFRHLCGLWDEVWLFPLAHHIYSVADQ